MKDKRTCHDEKSKHVTRGEETKRTKQQRTFTSTKQLRFWRGLRGRDERKRSTPFWSGHEIRDCGGRERVEIERRGTRHGFRPESEKPGKEFVGEIVEDLGEVQAEAAVVHQTQLVHGGPAQAASRRVSQYYHDVKSAD